MKRSAFVTFLILFFGILAWTLWMVAPYLLAVLMGAILAILAQPLYTRLIKRGINPTLSASIMTTAVLLLVVLPLGYFTVRAVKQGVTIGQAIANNDSLSFDSLVQRFGHWAPVEALVDDPAALDKEIRSGLQKAAAAGTAVVLGLAASIPELLLQLVLALIACFFFMIDGRRFVSWLASRIPMETEVRQKIVMTFKDTSISTVWATIAAAGAQAIVMLVAFLVLGVPAAFLAGGATFICAWIPILGSVPAWIAGAAYLYMQGAIGKMIAMIVFGMIAGVSDNLVRPLVLRGKQDMHPLVGLVAIFGGIQMFGLLGVFVGPIMVALLITLIQILPHVTERAEESKP